MMNETLSLESMKFIIERLVENANDAVEESERDKGDLFAQGKRLAYYEMLDTLNSELKAHGVDPGEVGIHFDVEALV